MNTQKKTTKNNTETGNAKNVDNFQKMISFIAAIGTKYNPSNPLIVKTALDSKFIEATGVMSNLTMPNVKGS